MPESERIVVYSPSDDSAGLAVSWLPNPGPHQTEFVVEQLWPPVNGNEGRADPVFVGDAQRVASLIEALSGLLQTSMEVRSDA